MIKFPDGFFWGAATSAYQVEGGNVNSDWWKWEIENGKERSGSACRHYELYRRDFDLAKELGHNCHRLSIEWARIEPEEGKFSEQEMKHYREVVFALRSRGIEPVVTLHHFTNPAWFSDSGGWQDAGSVERFLRYVEFVVRGLSGNVRFWITVNEPTIYCSHAYLFGWWPPQERSLLRAKLVEDNLLRAHIKAYRLIHRLHKELNFCIPGVSIAQNVIAFVPCTSAWRDRLACWIRNKWFNRGFLEAAGRYLDFIGINYYSRQLVELNGWGPGNFARDFCKSGHHPVAKNSLGWDIYPQGLYQVLMDLKDFNLPIMITENGICTDDDSQRWDYIRFHLKNVHRAREKGVKVSGYLYWSLMDNFEWDKGFGPKFGLVGFDPLTYERKVRESGRKFAEVCRTGILET